MLLIDTVHHVVDCVEVGADLQGTRDIQTRILTKYFELVIYYTYSLLGDDDTGAFLLNINVLEKVESHDLLIRYFKHFHWVHRVHCVNVIVTHLRLLKRVTVE